MPTPLDRALNSKNVFLDPENWTLDEMRRWLRARGLMPDDKATREELLERVQANLRHPRKSQK
ncbi:hypothetical protein BJY04DRAFT_221176 [Aspergillus karnatakaensis]|uniref:Ish1 domain-containing protein n=1 Tax=Aspergillus karnatakaensis TaxID=1810916 RepID=UPI003CCD4408